VGRILGRAVRAKLVLPVSEAPRVLFVIPGEEHGSSMIFARRQAYSLAREGVDVDMFHLRSRTSLREIAAEWLRFRQRVRRTAPHIIHAHFGTVTALFAALAAPQKPLVITFRGGDLNPSPSYASFGARVRAAAARAFSQVAAMRAGHIVCVSTPLRARLWWRGEKVTVLPSGVDPEVFRPEPRDRVRRRLGWSDAERVVVFNAGHSPKGKRLDLANAALGLTQEVLEGVRMVILYGEIPPAQIPELFNAADCLLLTSDTEGSPTVIQEALACNLPVVSVDAGDTAERLEGVSWSAIVARDPAAIAAELVRVLGIPCRSNGREKLDEFSAPKIARELRRIYAGLHVGGRWNTSRS
jgi:teichuronic acid biosynthesis glycosyltransferase TuaC